MAYTIGYKCAQNCCKLTILVQFIVENHMFLRHSILCNEASLKTCMWSTSITAVLPQFFPSYLSNYRGNRGISAVTATVSLSTVYRSYRRMPLGLVYAFQAPVNSNINLSLCCQQPHSGWAAWLSITATLFLSIEQAYSAASKASYFTIIFSFYWHPWTLDALLRLTALHAVMTLWSSVL